MRIDTIETPELGNRSYVVTDGSHAVVVDPQRDLDRIESVLGDIGADVTHVFETHIHNDYLTGGLELSRRCGADYAVNGAEAVGFDRRPVHDGEVLVSGTLRIRVLSTPGHTETHLSYVVEDDAESVVFTGGSLLFGSVGRTDLVDPARTQQLTRAQYASAHRLAGLPAATAVLPTHGFGSFCSSDSSSTANESTIGDEMQKNPVFLAKSEDKFVYELIASLGEYPAYYAHMAPLNRRGPTGVDLATPLPAISSDDLARRLRAGAAVVDLRDRIAFSARHAAGTISIERGRQLATYLGWLVRFDAPIALIADSTDDLADARRQLSRIGYDDVAGTTARIETFAAPTSAYTRCSFDDLARDRTRDDVLLDVRRRTEREEGFLPGSVHIPLHELPTTLGTIPRRRVWVHCVSGFRAGTAASMLDNAGFDVVHVDDHIERADALGLVVS
jgi:glyoxylase-like metal-dependent hydrolase (beta-lactamase superfamily II)/rhodanese-related sulfurtransferase